MSFDCPDYEIIKKILEGDKDSYERLVDKYQNKIFAMIANRIPRDDVSDIAQEAFLRIYRGLNAYVPNRPFEHWLSVITLRSCYDYWRSKSKIKEMTAPGLDYADHHEWLEQLLTSNSEEAFLRISKRDEARELLDWALRKLSASDRTMIEMLYLEEYSYKEVAEVLEWRLSKTKVRAMRAKKKLKKYITEYTEFIYNAE